MPDYTLRIIVDGEDRASGPLGAATSALGSMGTVAGGMLAAQLFEKLASEAVAFGKSIIDAASESEDALALLTQVIKNTGGETGVTVDQATSLALAFQQTTKFSDEQVMGAEKIIATFEHISSQTFPVVTQTALDMSTVLGMDATDAARMLGRALDQPATGLSALSRLGIKFTEDQKNVIKSMVETGDVAGAQAYMLTAIENRIGGSAEAMGKTFSGVTARIGHQWDEVKEKFGAPILLWFSTNAEELLPKVTGFVDEVLNFLGLAKPAAQEASTAMEKALKPTGVYGGTNSAADQAWRDYWNGKLVVAKETTDKIGALRPGGVQEGAGAVGPTALEQLKADLARLATPKGLADLMGGFDALKSSIEKSMPMILGHLNGFKDWFGKMAGAEVPKVLSNLGEGMKGLAQFWTDHGAQIMDVLGFVTKLAAVTGMGAVTLLSGWFAALGAGLQGDKVKQMEIVKNTLHDFADAASSIVGVKWDDAVAGWQTFFSSVGVLIGIGLKALTDKVGEWYGAGKAILDGLVKGVKDGLVTATQTIIKGLQDMVAAAKKALGISSPSDVFAGIGDFMMQGMGQGIVRSAGIPAVAVQRASGVAAAASQSWDQRRNLSIGQVNNYSQMDDDLFQKRTTRWLRNL